MRSISLGPQLRILSAWFESLTPVQSGSIFFCFCPKLYSFRSDTSSSASSTHSSRYVPPSNNAHPNRRSPSPSLRKAKPLSSSKPPSPVSSSTNVQVSVSTPNLHKARGHSPQLRSRCLHAKSAFASQGNFLS